MNPKNMIPGIFTSLNAFLGFWAMIKISESQFIYAAWFIILAVLCDGMDGKLARLTHCNDALGSEMDSLADLISFGVAPAFLVYQLVLKDFGIGGIFLSFLYTLSGLYRLARFNVLQKGERSQGYHGLPIPVAAMTVSALFLMLDRFQINSPYYIWIPFMFMLSGLMISTIPYNWPSLQFSNIRNSLYSIFILSSVISMLIIPRIMLFPCLVLYILFGIGNVIINSYVKVYNLKEESKHNIY